MKFQVNDVVLCVESYDSFLKRGEVCTIQLIWEDGDIMLREHVSWYYPSQFKLLAAFRKEDVPLVVDVLNI